MIRRSSTWTFIVGTVVVFALLFGGFGSIGIGFTWKKFLIFATAGAFLGAIAAPEFDESAFRWPVLWQVICAAIGCLVFAHAIQASTEGYALAAVLGLVLGYTAKYWVLHIPFP